MNNIQLNASADETQRKTIADLRASLAQAEARVKDLEAECRTLAAGQCPTAYGDERGNVHCREQDALRARLEAAKEALKPFGRTARHITDFEPHLEDGRPVAVEFGNVTLGNQLCMGDWRKLRSALADIEGRG